jgi:hypothetical protein
VEPGEQSNGYSFVEAKNLDEAIRIAATVPADRFSTVEIRPVLGDFRPPAY